MLPFRHSVRSSVPLLMMASLQPHHAPPPPSPPPPSAKAFDLEITVISAKHLKNVNWRNGELKPYAVVYLDPDRRAATKPDDAGDTRPVWNERLTLPFCLPAVPSSHRHHDFSVLVLTVDVFHSKPSETPKPLVGSARSSLQDLIDRDAGSSGASPIRTLELRRPSGRPQGKVRFKLALLERPAAPPEASFSNLPHPPFSAYYYSILHPPPPPPPPAAARDYRTFSPPPPPLPVLSSSYSHSVPPSQPSQYHYVSYADPYFSGFYSSGGRGGGYYSALPAPASAPASAWPYYDRVSGYGNPSAPSDYSSVPPSDHDKAKGGRMGLGAGLAVGAVAGALGDFALEERSKYHEEKIAEKADSDHASRNDYSDYRTT